MQSVPITSNFREDETFPSVSIIRPVKGIDTELRACLEATFNLVYDGPVEILICIAEESDPAITLVRQLIAENAGVNCQLLVCNTDCGPNPKICNIAYAYAHAKHDIVWILDANVWVSPNTLDQSIQSLADCSLVHHLPLVIGISDDVGSFVEETFMATSHAKFYTAINTLRVAPCLMGKSNLFRRSDLGPIDRFAINICEDQLIGEYLWAKCGPHRFCPGIVAYQPIGNELTFAGYWERRKRWLRIRKYVVTAATLVEPFTECFACGYVGALAFAKWFPKWWFLGVHCCVWAVMDYYQFINLFSQDINSPHRPTWLGNGPRSFPSFIKTWLLREICALPIWLDAMRGSKVSWRNKLFRVHRDKTVTAWNR